MNRALKTQMGVALLFMASHIVRCEGVSGDIQRV